MLGRGVMGAGRKGAHEDAKEPVEFLALARGRRLLTSLRRSTDEPPAQAGKLNQKRV